MDVAQRRDGEWIIVERGRHSRPVPDKATHSNACVHAYVKHTPTASSTDAVGLFLRYVCGTDFQAKDLREFGFLRIADLGPPAVESHAGYPKPTPCGGA